MLYPTELQAPFSILGGCNEGVNNAAAILPLRGRR